MASVALLYSCNDKNADGTSTTDSSSMNSTTMNDAESKEERNKETALASVNVIASGNVDAVLKDVDKDAVEYHEGSMGPTKGLDSIKAGLGGWMAAVPDYKGSDLMAVADGDYVMVYGTWTGTWKNDFMGMKATGKTFKVNDVDIFKFNDAGKIIEHRGVQSNATAGMQLGMPMPDQPKQ